VCEILTLNQYNRLQDSIQNIHLKGAFLGIFWGVYFTLDAQGGHVVDIVTFNQLSADEQSEFRRFSKQFIKAVRLSGVSDGFEFQEQYAIKRDGEYYFLSKGSDVFANIKSRSRRVIETLLSEAVQNHGR
jgi:hypothetical protein